LEGSRLGWTFDDGAASADARLPYRRITTDPARAAVVRVRIERRFAAVRKIAVTIGKVWVASKATLTAIANGNAVPRGVRDGTEMIAPSAVHRIARQIDASVSTQNERRLAKTLASGAHLPRRARVTARAAVVRIEVDVGLAPILVGKDDALLRRRGIVAISISK